MIASHTLHFFKTHHFSYREPEITRSEEESIIKSINCGIPAVIVMVQQGDGNLKVLRGERVVQSIIDYYVSLTDAQIEFSLGPDFDNDEFLDKEIVMVLFPEKFAPEAKDEEDICKAYRMFTGEATYVPVYSIKPLDETPAMRFPVQHPFCIKHGITEDMLIPLYMVTDEGVDCELSKENIAKFKETLTEVPDITPVLSYMGLAFPEQKDYIRNVNLPMLFLTARYAMHNEIEVAKYGLWVESLFENNAYPDETYKAACSHSTSKKNVNIRISILMEKVKTELN